MTKKIRWHQLSPSDFEGKGWSKTESPFDRLPAKIKDILPDVWKNGHSSTGMCLSFDTDSTAFHVKYTLGLGQIGEPNFNVAAHCGVDLYFYDTAGKHWRWGAAMPHFAIQNQKPQATLIEGLPAEGRRCRLYMPMRNQLLKIAVGVDSDADFNIAPPRTAPPLVYYGTSIIHGAFAGRPGLGTAQILARNLDMPLINLGFSGAAKLEKEMAQLLTELNAGIFIIDPYHNLTAGLVRSNAENFIEILCARHPDTPVFMLGAPQHFHSWLKPELKQAEEEKTRLYGRICRKMMRKYPNLHYLEGKNFYGGDETSVDGIHPNDEAFSRMAGILTREISKSLKSPIRLKTK